MSSWDIIRMQEAFNRPFIDRVIKNKNIFEANRKYKLALVYGKAGNFKSSTINMYLRSDRLDSGLNSDGITKGIYLCKKGDFIIADTEGTGTDNNSATRHDIVSLFCVCSSLIIVNAIHTRFPISDITEMINEKLAVLQKMFQSDPSEINKPLLIILCPIGNNMKLDKVQSFRQDAEKYRQNNIPKDIKTYFSDVIIKVLSPLPPVAHDKIYEDNKFSVNDLEGSLILNEVDEVFNLALNQNKNSKSGRCFHLLNHYLNLAQTNKLINPLLIEKATEFIEKKLEVILKNSNTYNCNYMLYQSIFESNKSNVINEIKCLDMEISYKDYYITKFEEEFLKFRKNHGDIYNEALLTHIEKIYENGRTSIIKEIQSNINLTYIDLETLISKSVQRLNGIKINDIANDKGKIVKISNLIKSKLNQLHSYDFQDVYIQNRVCKIVQDDYYNEIKETLIKVKIKERESILITHKTLLSERLKQAITNFYTEINQQPKNKSSLINTHIESLYRDSFEYYQNNFYTLHERYNIKIEEARLKMVKTVNDLILEVGNYNPRIIDRFSTESNSIDTVFYNEIGKFYYDIYADELFETVIISQYNLISATAVKSCIYSTAYYECPYCKTIWEKRLEVDISSYIGCGNFTCKGKKFGCNGKVFRTEMKQANESNQLARQLEYKDLENMFDQEIKFMEELTLKYLRKDLVKKY